MLWRARTTGHDGGMRRGERDAFIAGHGVCGPPSPFRRLTTARADLAAYIDGWESKRPSTAAFPGADAI